MIKIIRTLVVVFSVFTLFASCSMGEVDMNEYAVGTTGSITRFAVYGDYMYALDPNKVLTYNIEQPEKPVLVHTLVTDYGLETIHVYDGTIFIGSMTSLYILDISVPAQPELLSKTDRGIGEVQLHGCDPVVVKDNYAYSTIKTIQNICGDVSTYSALMVFDVTDKTAPVTVGTYSLSQPNGLAYKGNLLFICDDGTDEIRAFDISNPLQLQPIDTNIPIVNPIDLIIDGNRMIVSTDTNFTIYEISSLLDIRKLATIQK